MIDLFEPPAPPRPAPERVRVVVLMDPLEVAPENTKVCSRCLEDKPFAMFSASKDSSDGLHSWCRACKCEDQQARKQRARQATG